MLRSIDRSTLDDFPSAGIILPRLCPHRALVRFSLRQHWSRNRLQRRLIFRAMPEKIPGFGAGPKEHWRHSSTKRKSQIYNFCDSAIAKIKTVADPISFSQTKTRSKFEALSVKTALAAWSKVAPTLSEPNNAFENASLTSSCTQLSRML